MSHFVSGFMPSMAGLVASMNNASVSNLTSTGNTSTDNTDRLSYTVPVSGFYRLSGAMILVTASSAATSHAAVLRASYNNGSSISNSNLGVTQASLAGTLDLKGGSVGAAIYQSDVVYCVAGTTLDIHVSHAVSGAGASGTCRLVFAIEGVSDNS